MTVQDSTSALRRINNIVFTLAIIGSFGMLMVGFAGYIYMIAASIASLLFSTLIYFVVTVFWEHVQRSANRES